MSSAIMSNVRNFQAIMWMLLASLCWAGMAIVIRLSSFKDPFVTVFITEAIALIVIWLLARMRRQKIARPKYWRNYIIRGFLGNGTFLFWIFSMSYMALTDVTALKFTAPLFTVLFAIIIFKEPSGWCRILGLVAGFFGVLFVIYGGDTGSSKDQQVNFIIGASFAIGSALCWGISNLIIKHITKIDGQQTSLFYSLLMMMVIVGCISFSIGDFPDNMTQWGWLLFLGIINYVGLVSTYRAYHMAYLTLLMPFDFSILIFIAILEYLIWNTMISSWTLVGSVVIISGAYLTIYKEHKQHRARKRST